MKKCYQCGKPVKRKGSYFCSEECRDKYYPKKKQESFADKLKKLNDINGLGRRKLNLITLKCGYKAWFDPDSQEKCSKCGADIWWVTTDKNKRPMPVNMVGDEYDTHFAYCDKEIKQRELIKDAEEIFL